MQCHVYQPKRIRDGKRIVSRIFWGKLRLEGESKPTSFSLETSDKKAALAKLDAIRREKEQERVGLLAPESAT